MNTNKVLTLLGITVIACMVLAGCGKNGAQAGSRLFDKAAPEIKVAWEQAIAADKANDYLSAATNYNQLVAWETKLTSKQFETVVTASRTFTQRMIAAADSGDSAARQAMVALGQMNQQRIPH